MYGWLVCGCVGSLARLSISRKTNALMLRDGNLAVMLPRRTAVALLALCGLIAVGDGKSGVCVCHLSVCIYLFDRLLVCVERECGQAVLCWTGQPGSHHGAVSGVCKPVICGLNHFLFI